MDPEYESKQKRCSIKKGQQVQVIVKESSSEIPQRGGNLLWRKTSKEFTSMHAVIKAIYEALPEYKGKRVFVDVWNKTSGERERRSHHYIPKNRIPFTL